MIPDEEGEIFEEEINEVWWTWTDPEYIDDLFVRRVEYLMTGEHEPKLLVIPIPEIHAEWTLPLIDQIDAKRMNVCDVVCLMWIVGLGGGNGLTPIRYTSREDFDILVDSRRAEKGL